MNIQKINLRTSGFTLVELIVVITILAILWAIAFISLQWYSTDARDSTRISDISIMRTSLELYNLEAWKYPNPTNYVNIDYSWAIVWNQWTFWESVFANVTKLDKIPLDPITNKEYTYSTTSNKYEFQIWGIMEGETISMNNEKWIMNNNVNAADIIATAYVWGTYNWILTKTYSGTNCNVLSVPSIITNDIVETDLQDIVTNNNFVFSWFQNLPASFKSSKFKYNWWFAFQPNNLIAYSDTWSCASLIESSSSGTSARIQLLSGLQNSYSGTLLNNVWEISNITSMNIDTNNPSPEVVTYSNNFANNILWTSLVSSSSSSSSSSTWWWNSCSSTQPANATLTAWSPLTSNQAWQNTDSNSACFFSCNSWFWWDWTDCLVATQCTNSLQEITLNNWQIWSCKNIWATEVWLWVNSYWSFYQWWNNTTWWHFWWTAWVNAWWDITNTDLARQWPCPTWWHIPSHTEWQSACNDITSNNCSVSSTTLSLMRNKLQLPYWGTLQYNNWSAGSVWSIWFYWSSTHYATTNSYAIMQRWTYSDFYIDNYSEVANGFKIRCIKN